MSRQRSTVWTIKGLAILGCASLLTGAPVSDTSAQEVPPDPVQAIKSVLDQAARRSELQHEVSGQPGIPTRESPSSELGFALSGVVIAGETRLALLQKTTANSGPPRLLPVGASLAGHRITDVQPDRVTLETASGQRVMVKLRVGGGVETGVSSSVTTANRQALPPAGDGAALPSAPPPERAEGPEPASGGNDVEEPESVAEKEQRQARLAEREAADKARGLAQRAPSAHPTPSAPMVE
jgi:hypothetical protein